jgi:hypothetical protein
VHCMCYELRCQDRFQMLSAEFIPNHHQGTTLVFSDTPCVLNDADGIDISVAMAVHDVKPVFKNTFMGITLQDLVDNKCRIYNNSSRSGQRLFHATASILLGSPTTSPSPLNLWDRVCSSLFFSSLSQAAGQLNNLSHAIEVGNRTVQNPCEMCPENDKKSSGYTNAAGQLNKLCSSHARGVGTYKVQTRASCAQ